MCLRGPHYGRFCPHCDSFHRILLGALVVINSILYQLKARSHYKVNSIIEGGGESKALSVNGKFYL